MDIEAMPKPNWRENLTYFLDAMREEEREQERKAKKDSMEIGRAAAEARCKRGKVALEAHGVEISRTVVVEAESRLAFSGYEFFAYCWAGDYRFGVFGSSTDDLVTVGVSKTCLPGVFVESKQYIFLPETLNFAKQRALAEMLEDLDQQELRLKEQDISAEQSVNTVPPTDAETEANFEPTLSVKQDQSALFRFSAETYNIAERSEELTKLASAISDLKVNTDHILYRRLLLILSDMYAEYSRWVNPNTPAQPLEDEELPF